jgi:Tol biopolymer transport system component/DNA-binding winged helix-turn-helix (wHTH) protein
LASSVLRFGEFELDPVAYELRKRGRRIKLQPIPMELLLLLAGRNGELVRRGELSQIWDSDDPADVERSINTAVRKIRQALGDDADRPRFIETVPGKGYRFIAAVSEPERERGSPVAAVPSHDTDGSARKQPVALAWYGVAFFGIGVLAAAALWMRTPREAKSMAVAPFTALPGSEFTPAFSPDGTQVAFGWDSADQVRRLHVKASAGGIERRLTSASESDSYPAWSPDGRFIAFLREDARQAVSLWVTPATGGGERKICSLSHAKPASISWSADGSALAVADSDPPAPSGIYLVSRESGERRRLTTAPNATSGDSQPAFSPDGRTLAFLRSPGSLQGGSPYLLRVNRSGIPIGEPVAIASRRMDLISVTWSADGGSLICGVRGGLVRIPVRGGVAEPLPFQDAANPSVARSGRRMVYARSVEQTAIFRVPGPGRPGASAELIVSSRFNGAPKYSPDGKRIVFMSDRTGGAELWLTDSDGQHANQLTSFGRATLGSPRWSPDGRRVAFDSTADGPAKIYWIAAEGGAPRRITSGGSSDVRPSWSRDGAWIYFGSNRSGQWEIWKTSPDGEAPVQVTQTGGREAFQDSDGKFLYYVKAAPTPGIWRIPVSGGQPKLVCEEGTQGHWGIGQRGLYYLNRQNRLELLEHSTGNRIAIPIGDLQLSTSVGSLLGIGPADRWILLTVRVRSESDLSMVENFR